jgi:hypothetical protein
MAETGENHQCGVNDLGITRDDNCAVINAMIEYSDGRYSRIHIMQQDHMMKRHR